MGRKLLILSQIGSPSKPEPDAVGDYLRRFLMDKRILDIPWFFRWILVNIGIVPRRKKASAEKYHNIWTIEGSPLVVETTKFAEQLKTHLSDIDVVIHWRYGEKNADEMLKPFSQIKYKEVMIAPMYPQFAMATTGSAFDVLIPVVRKYWAYPATNIKTLKPFYADEGFLNSWVERLKPFIANHDHVLFSFHGLPISQIKKTAGCELNSCCEKADISGCYYAQCKKTVKFLVEKLHLTSDQYTLCFQSRVGPKKWLEPSTDVSTEALVKQKQVKKLLVACPAFVTDGLETLEEINIELHHNFKNWGGEKFTMVESLNSLPLWINGFSQLIDKSESWDQNHS